MMDRLPWWSTLKKYKYPFVGLALFGAAFLLLLVFNLWQFSTQSASGEYQPSRLEWLERPTQARLGKPLTLAWRITAPTPRLAERTALFWGEESSPSAQLEGPQSAIYPQMSPDYWQGPFVLPDRFEVTLVPDREGVLFLRLYARVDNQHLWSEEVRLQVQP